MIYDITHRDEPFFAKITCGPSHNIALDKTGKVYSWGDSSDNCLGFYSKDDVPSPRQVISLTGLVVVDASCGENFTYIIAGDRTLDNQKSALQMLNMRYLESMRAKVKTLNNQFHHMHEHKNLDSSPTHIKLQKSTTKITDTVKVTLPDEIAMRAHTISDLSVGHSQTLHLLTDSSAEPLYKGLSQKKMQKEVWNNQINMIVDDTVSSPGVSNSFKKFPIVISTLEKSN
jgi:hypothetical protein